jgi:hypothetical protein
MAKKKVKGKRVSMGAETVPMEPMPRRVYIDLADDELDILKNLSVGDKVVLTVSGKVSGMSSRENDYGAGAEKRGDIQIEDPDIELDSPNDFEELSKDDD